MLRPIHGHIPKDNDLIVLLILVAVPLIIVKLAKVTEETSQNFETLLGQRHVFFLSHLVIYGSTAADSQASNAHIFHTKGDAHHI